MTNRNDISLPFSKVQEFVRPVWNAPRGLRAALAAGALGLAALAFAVPQGANVTTLPELGIDAGPPLSVSNAASYGFSGTCSENLQTVSLSVRHIATGSGVEAPAVPCLGGIWQLAGLNLSGLAEGLLAVSVSHNDLAGQRVELNASLAKGGSLPRVGIDAPAPIHAGNLDAYTLSGSCSEEGQKLALSLIDGLGRNLLIPLIAQPVCIGQRWSAVLPGLSALQDGAITLTVTHSDIRSGASTLTTQAMKNGVMPGLSIDPLLFVKEANQASFPVGGACSEAKQPVYLSISDNNKVTVYGSSLCSGKRWSLPALNLTSLAGGELRFVATHTSAMQLGRTVEQAGLKDSAVAGAAVTNAATTLASTAFAGQQAGSTAQAKAQSLLPTQSITFNSLSKKALGDVPFTVSATASSGLPVSFSSLTPLVCTTTGSQGNTVTLLLMGTCTIQANQPGNAQTSAATPVAQSFTVGVQARGAFVPAIAAGGGHTLAIKVDGTVWAWGDNERGQLGAGTSTMHSTPVLVPGLSATAVGAGVSHSVALTKNGSIMVWGGNDFGQLGNGGTASSTNGKSPAALIGSGLPTFSVIAVGANHTLALTSVVIDATGKATGGEVWAWGANGDGQLGDGTQVNNATPTKIANLTGVIAIAAGGNYSLALMGDNTVQAWGKTGDATTGVVKPTPVSGLTNIAAIAAGRDHALALTIATTDPLTKVTTNKVKAWGSNWAGQLGSTAVAPVELSFDSPVTVIRAGNGFSLALLNGGAVYAWGNNAAGQSGSAVRSVPSPTLIVNLPAIQALAAGDNHAVATDLGNQVWAWGDNGRGQLGDGTLTYRQEPVSIATTILPTPTSVMAGAYHVMSLGGSDNNRSWGSNWKGQLAETTLYKTTPLASSLTVTPIAAGMAYTLSGLQSVGDNLAGELGRTLTGTPTPTWIASLGAVAGTGLPTGFTSVAAGTRHSLASSGSDLWVWGANEAGQWGDGKTVGFATATSVVVPVVITAPGTTNPTIQALAAGASHSVALVGTKDATTGIISGDVYVWGSNLLGQLGIATAPAVPMAFKDQNPLALCKEAQKTSQIASGWYHTAALCGGSVWTWGNNSMEQLGRVPDATTNAPAVVSGITFGANETITKIAAGAYHTLAMTSAGVVWAWGGNQYGQLGNASTANSALPVKIVASGASTIAAGAGYSVIVKSAGETVVMGDGRDGQLGLGDTATAIRSTPKEAMISLAGGPAVSLVQSTVNPSFSLSSSLVGGTAYWLLQRSSQPAPTLTTIKTGATGSGAISAGGSLSVFPPSLVPGAAYRLFVCVAPTPSNSTDGACSGNAASVDFVVAPTVLQLATSVTAGVNAAGTKVTTITVTRSGDLSQAATVTIVDTGNSAPYPYALSTNKLSFEVGVAKATFTITPKATGTVQLKLSIDGVSSFGSVGTVTVNMKKPALTPILMLLLD